MEKALCKGQLRMAYNIALNSELEKEIRKASKAGEILCPDVECKAPALRYCHGGVYSAYFAHKSKDACDYALFDKKDNATFRYARHVLCEHFENMGYQVFLEEKLLDHHYTHLVLSSVQSQKDEKIAIELGDIKVHPKYMRQINDEYFARGITVNWLLVDDEQRSARIEYKKYLEWYLNSGACNKHLIVLSNDIKEVAEYKEICIPGEFPQKLGTIDGLSIISGEIALK